jgi:signal transduction histidine kinase
VKFDPENTGVVPVIGETATVRGAVLKPTLVCVSGNDMGRSFRLDSSKVLGRSSVEIELADRDVSRRHAKIHHDHGYEIEDLDSLNGTFVNGQRITRRTTVKVGDRIQVGRTVFLFTIQDELEQRMMSIVRLEAMATLAGGIAHDFNNALAVVVGNLDYINEVIPPHEREALQCLEEMRTASMAAVSLARQLLQLGRADPEPFTSVSLTEIVSKTAAMARRRAKSKIAVTTTIPPGLDLLGSADDLIHVLLNLCYNACDAMKEGGRLDIDARAVHVDANEALRYHLDLSGEYVEIRVTDTGHGMDPATLERVFDPFFTTKPRGEGTGLGLAMVHATMRRHGGAIDVQSTVGKGTIFTLLLPRPAAHHAMIYAPV